MKTKKCIKCGNIKPIDEFSKRKDSEDGHRNQCKKCRKQYHKQYSKENKEHIKQYHKRYREKNKEHKKQLDKQYRENNKESIKQWCRENKEYFKQYYQNNKQKKKQYLKQWRKDNPNYDRIWQKQRYQNNTQLKLSFCISSGIRQALRNNKNGRHWEDMVNFTLQDLMQHLEKQFKDNMTWANHGTIWEIDHKIPVTFFNFKSYKDTEFKLCWCLGNLQPLRTKENNSKNNKLIHKHIKDIRLTNEMAGGELNERSKH
jgi:hypothetical protein